MVDTSTEAVNRAYGMARQHGLHGTAALILALAAGRGALRVQQGETRDVPKVKPLVWGHHPCGAIAAPPTNHAYIIDTRMKGRVYSVKGFNPQREFASLDEAKAAAQADYERRILDALE